MSHQSTPILTLSVTLTGVTAAHRFVTPLGTQAAAGVNTLGVARTGGAIGALVPVDALGTTVVEAGAAFSAGDTIKTDATGRGIEWATSGAKVAIALQDAAAAGDFVEALLIPNAA